MAKNKYFNKETSKGDEVVYVPDGNAENIEAGVPISFIANAPLFIELLNKNYGITLLHYQSADKIDLQRLIIRTVREYLERIAKEN